MDKAKNDIILATLVKHCGSCKFEHIMEVAEEHHCDVAGAALTSLKRAKKVDFDSTVNSTNDPSCRTILIGGRDAIRSLWSSMFSVDRGRLLPSLRGLLRRTRRFVPA